MQTTLLRAGAGLATALLTLFASTANAEPGGGFLHPRIQVDTELSQNALAEPRRADGLIHLPKRPKSWAMYGRISVLNFHNELGAHEAASTKLSFKRTGPALSGKVYVGIHRQW